MRTYLLWIIGISLLCSAQAQSKGSYQVDVIVFAHPQNPHAASPSKAPLIPVNKNAIVLQAAASAHAYYRLLPESQSLLRNEYYLLKHRSHFRVLGRYSWTQPTNSQQAVALPPLQIQGWLMQGTIYVQKNNFYTFNTDLQFSPPNDPETSFTVKQTQRLKDNTVYYLDHPEIGLVVKVHHNS